MLLAAAINTETKEKMVMITGVALVIALAAGGGALGIAVVLRETFAPPPPSVPSVFSANKDCTTPPPSVGTVASSLPSAPDIFIYYAYPDRATLSGKS